MTNFHFQHGHYFLFSNSISTHRVFQMFFIKEGCFSLLLLIAIVPAFQMHMLDIGSRLRRPKSSVHRQTTLAPLARPTSTDRSVITISNRVVNRACTTLRQVGRRFTSVHGCLNNMVRRCECIGVKQFRCNHVCIRMDYYALKVRVG